MTKFFNIFGCLQKTVCVFLAVFFSISLYGLSPEQKMNRFTTECFDSSNGLPQNTISDILQDKTGYMIFATQEGPVKYDGRIFQALSGSGHSNSLSRNITSLYEQENGNIVFAAASGLFDTNGHIKNILQKKDLFDGMFVKDLLFDKQGNLWVGTYSSGIIKVDKNGKEEVFKKENGRINTNIISSLFMSSKGKIYAATLEGLSRLEKDSFVPIEGVYAFSYKIAEDSNGWIWVATERGLALSKEDKLDYIYTAEDGLHDESLRTVYFDRNGSLWIGTEQGSVLRFFNGKFSRLSNIDIKTGAVISIFEDRESNMWFGTETTGVCIIRDGTIFQAGINSGNVRSLTETADGDIWAATFGEGIKILKKDESVATLTSKDGLRSDSISTVFADSAGRVWIGTRRNGVQVYSKGNIYDLDSLGKSFSEVHPVSPTLFFEDSRGNIWIADRHSHRPVFLWNNGQMTTYEIIKGELSILDIAENNKGSVHLLSMNDGIFEFDANNNEFNKIAFKDNLKMASLFFDSSGRMWVTTLSQGIVVKAGDEFFELNESNGLYSNTIHDIAQDGNGAFWFSTNKGIFMVTGEDVDKLISGAVDRLSVMIFKEEDGMPAGECNGGSQPSVIKSSDGTLWFPTIKGVVTVDPAKIEQRVELPPVSISSAVVDNVNMVDLSGKNELTVKPGTKNIMINFTSLYFSHPAKVRFEYKLEGFDSSWNIVAARRMANYTNLSPGTYTFLVKSYLADTPDNFSTTSIKLNVKPFFYQDSRFRTIAAIILLLMMLAAYNLKIRMHKVREKELRRIVDQRTEELLRANEKLKQSILKDPMTGLCNRRYLFEIEQPRYERILFAAKKKFQGSDGKPVKLEKVTGLFLIDIAGLKKINEKRGYDFGDRLLKSFAESLKDSVRKDDLVVRWGGDEFLVILNATDYEHLPVYAKKILSMGLEGIPMEGEEPMKIVVTTGFSAMPFYPGEHSLNFEESLLMSDMALFKALSKGHGSIKQAVPGSAVPEKEQIESFMKDIDNGIKNDFFDILDV